MNEILAEKYVVLKEFLDSDAKVMNVQRAIEMKLENCMTLLRLIATRDNRVPKGWHKLIPVIKQSLLRARKATYVKELIEQLRTGGKVDVRIKRRKAYYFIEAGNCDHSGTMTIYGQIFQQINGKPRMVDSMRMNNVDSQWFDVKIAGEGSIDAGGVFRDAMVNICQELMSRSLPLLIPTPNNKN